MDLSESNLVIPLTEATYEFCWKRVYLGVMADSDDDVPDEVNNDNNAGFYKILLDCGGMPFS